MTQEANVDGGVFKVSMAADGQRVPFYNFYDPTGYAASKATLESLLVVQV